jgi:hypothetical protein
MEGSEVSIQGLKFLILETQKCWIVETKIYEKHPIAKRD